MRRVLWSRWIRYIYIVCLPVAGYDDIEERGEHYGAGGFEYL
jgi:hypothetical protein